ncbi:hypothetical protein ElyMa_002280200 [Elysia marginata]|uniref:Uncharacterized protein n=1 Tax=Elysia marginata TaxID=1093978 RepID=A0AAV4G0H0_9GAST|nr:hypothetical protein ElyMa_002280200 [Elysia marginata]
MAGVGSTSISMPEVFSSTPPVAAGAVLPEGECRDRYGRFNSSFFPLLACSLCFTYLFPGEQDLAISHATWPLDLTTLDGEPLSDHIALYPSLLQEGPAKLTDQAMCRELGDAGCRRLAQCCSSAIR